MKLTQEDKKDKDHETSQMTSFRPRQIDIERPLPIFTTALESANKISRSVPVFGSGMERDEEVVILFFIFFFFMQLKAKQKYKYYWAFPDSKTRKHIFK